jgi:hypothetical protein
MNAERGRTKAWWLLAVLLAAGVGTFLACRPDTTAPHSNATPTDPEDNQYPPALRSLSADVKKNLVRNAAGDVLTDLYRDVTAQSGISFTYRNGEEAGHFAILESLGGGVGLLDYDGDGLLDVVVTGGGYYDGPEHREIKGHGNRIYKNLGNGQFKDVTREVGLDQPLFYSHGVAVCDYDRDGWPDLLITGWGRMALYHNEPDGKGGRRFREVTKAAGLPEKLWTTSAAWADLDGDGFPDLYVCQYVDWSMDNNKVCPGYNSKVKRDICAPKQFTGLPHHLFRNNGNGTFTDVSKEAGLRPHTGDPLKDNENGKGLGVVIVDVDGDGKPDIWVANDTVDKFLYLNHSVPGKIRLEEVGLSSGVARDDRGVPNGSMGTDAADYDGRGLASLWCTNYENEMHALYRNMGKGLFLFNTPASGIAAIGQLYVGFGTGFIDLDNHGWEDLVVTNGHVIRYPQGATLTQKPVLLRNKGNGRFCDITPQGGSYFRSEHIGRGLVWGDLDNKGRFDLIISHVNEPVAVLRNEADTGNHWLGIELAGKDRRDVVGAKIVVEVRDGTTERKLTRFAKGGCSYMSTPDRRHLFGLGKEGVITRVTVSWPPSQDKPQGHVQQWAGASLKKDHYWRLVEGKEAAQSPVGQGRLEAKSQ